MHWPTSADRELVKVLRELVGGQTSPVTCFDERLFVRAELHGLAGLLHDLALASGASLGELNERLGRTRIARELDHDAHLAMLRKIDGALHDAGLRAVALKGVLLAERMYSRPAARSTTDIDLLVVPEDLARATAALGKTGYELADDAAEQARAMREHHHLHFGHAHGPALELHFHAYRGFGETLFAAPLIERSEVVSVRGPFSSIRVLAPADELLFLSVHAAAHRFVRLAWLCDVRLLLDRLSADDISTAVERAARLGYARALAITAMLLVELLGADESSLRPMRRLEHGRTRVVRRIVGEPPGQLARSLSRFVYTAALCDSSSAAARFISEASGRRLKAVFGSRPSA